MLVEGHQNLFYHILKGRFSKNDSLTVNVLIEFAFALKVKPIQKDCN